MRAVLVGVEVDAGDPLVHDPGILAGREVLAAADTAGKEIVLLTQCALADPGSDSATSWLCQLTLDRMSRLLLDDHGPFSHPAAGDHVTEPQGDKVTAAQLAVDSQVKQGDIPPFPFDLEPSSDWPRLLGA
jgi:hypothetical protein